nr:hypothetical protein [Candidatus Dependentiae bacterium]
MNSEINCTVCNSSKFLYLFFIIMIPCILLAPYYFSDKYIGGESNVPSTIKFNNDSYAQKIPPSWDPYRFGGTPYLADAPFWGYYYPTHYLYYLLNIDYKNQLFIDVLLHFILIGIVCFFGFISLKSTAEVSFFGTLIVMGSSYLQGLIGAGYMMFLISVPLMFACYFFIENWILNQKNIYLILFSICLGLDLLGGFFYATVYMNLIIFARILYEDFLTIKIKKNKTGFSRFLIIRYIIAVIIGFCLGSIQFIPMAFYSKTSMRGDHPFWWNGEQSYNPIYIFKLFLIPGIAIGSVLPFLLIISSKFSKLWEDKITKFWIIIISFLILYSMGYFMPVFYLVTNIPGFKFLRRPHRALYCLSFGFAIINVYILTNYKSVFETSRELLKKNIKIISVISAAVFFYGLIISFFFNKIDFFYTKIIERFFSVEFLKNNLYKINERLGFRTEDILESVGMPWFLILTAAIILLFIIIKKNKTRFIFLLIMLAVLELFTVFFMRKNSYKLMDYEDITLSGEVLDYIADRNKRIIIYKEKNEYYNPYFTVTCGMDYYLYSIHGVSNYISKRFTTFIIETVNNDSVKSSYKAPELVYVENYNSGLLKYLDAEYLVSPVKIISDNWELLNPGSKKGFVYKYKIETFPVYFFYKEKKAESLKKASEELKKMNDAGISDRIITEENSDNVIDSK